jgi:predicted HicB family RNase H-like nuclease
MAMARQKTLDDRLEIRLPHDLARAAQLEACKTGKSLSEIARELLAAWLAGKHQTTALK